MPVLTEEIDGSAFLNCPRIGIGISTGSLNFKGKSVPETVRVFGKSCFEACERLDPVNFEIGSELKRIGRAALHDCISLSRIEIILSVSIIEESSFEACAELESCLNAKDC
jgi:hypothetical protein